MKLSAAVIFGLLGSVVSPVLAVSSRIFLDTLTESREEQPIQLNPIDLGGESKWDNSPLLKKKKGQPVWLWTSEGEMKVLIDRIVITRREADERFLFRGSINAVVRAETPIPVGRVMLSLKPIPAQTWKTRIPSEDEKKLIAAETEKTETGLFMINVSSCYANVITTKKGQEYFIFRYPIPNKLNQEKYRAVIYLKDEKAAWTSYKRFDDAVFEPWVDVDGDGVPELVGESGLESFALKSFHPYAEIIQQSTSGI